MKRICLLLLALPLMVGCAKTNDLSNESSKDSEIVVVDNTATKQAFIDYLVLCNVDSTHTLVGIDVRYMQRTTNITTYIDSYVGDIYTRATSVGRISRVGYLGLITALIETNEITNTQIKKLGAEEY